MSDPKKGQQDDFVDFGDFDSPSAPPPPEASDDFSFEDAPQPASSRTAAARPLDDFSDLTASHDEDADPFPPSRRSSPVEEKDDFGDIDDEPAPVVPSRLRRNETASPAADDDAMFDEDDDARVAQAVDYDDDEFVGTNGNAAGAEEEESEAPPPKKSNLVNYAIYAVGGVFALGIAWLGYSSVLKPLMGWDAPVQVASPMTPPMAPRPATNSQPAPGLPPLGAAPSAQAPQAPRPLPSTAAAPAPTAVPAPVPAPQAGGLPPIGGASPITPPRPAAPATVPAPVAAASADPAVADRISRVETRVASLPTREDLEARLKVLEERLARFENRSVPAAPRPEVTVPVKPRIIDGWTLQGVNRDTAWVKGPRGIVEAREDTDLGPDAGQVTRIQRFNNSWIVVTTTGVIMRN